VSFIDILRAEFKLEYNDVFRRKSVLVMLVLYPYIFTLFTLFIGYAGGSPEYFTMRVKVEPVVYLITASYMLMSIFASIDVLLWRPLYDERNGTTNIHYSITSKSLEILTWHCHFLDLQSYYYWVLLVFYQCTLITMD